MGSEATQMGMYRKTLVKGRDRNRIYVDLWNKNGIGHDFTIFYLAKN